MAIATVKPKLLFKENERGKLIAKDDSHPIRNEAGENNNNVSIEIPNTGVTIF